MNQTLFVVDVFTNQKFKGNPAGVCLLDKQPSDDWMQNIATELNLSDTAYLLPNKNEENCFDLRWFTPIAEIDLCGHATLGSAHVLWEQNIVAKDAQIKFLTRYGALYAKYVDGYVAVEFPQMHAKAIELTGELSKNFGSDINFVGKNQFDHIIELKNAKSVVDLKPDFNQLKQFDNRGFIITAKGENVDFVSRCFYPNLGINEDPVTGSAHCCLGPYWFDKLGKSELTAYQASKRGGYLKLKVVANDRIVIYGQAISVFKNTLV